MNSIIYFCFFNTLLISATIWNCNNLCPFAFDKECDDGGINSTSLICMFGSDCSDCGKRPDYTRKPSIPKTNTPTILVNWTANPGSLNIGIRTRRPTMASSLLISLTPTKKRKKNERKKLNL
jgi:hypothetical protein